MNPNPIAGVLLHAVGGLASASFYIPFRGVKVWAWETYWLVGGVFSWIIAPWTIALLLVPNLFIVLRNAPINNLAWTYIFGVLWGVGGLTFGLTMERHQVKHRPPVIPSIFRSSCRGRVMSG